MSSYVKSSLTLHCILFFFFFTPLYIVLSYQILKETEVNPTKLKCAKITIESSCLEVNH